MKQQKDVKDIRYKMRTIEQFKSLITDTLFREFNITSANFHEMSVATRREVYGVMIYRYKGIGEPMFDVTWDAALQWRSIDDIALSLYNAQHKKDI